jgi:hypothetical protein
MKKTLIAVLLSAAASAFAATIEELYEKAYFLETARGQTEPALEIYRKIAATKPTDETREVTLKALDRLQTSYRTQCARTFRQVVDDFDMKNGDIDDLVEAFGEPERYIFKNEVYTKDNLPMYYAMVYNKDFCVWMKGKQAVEFRFEGSPVYEIGGISIGTRLSEVLDILGSPSETLDGEECTYAEGILYKNSPGRPKTHAYYSAKGLRLFFLNNRVCALYVTDNRILAGK